MHETLQANLCLISDTLASIKSISNNPKNGWQSPLSTQIYCIRHITMPDINGKNLHKKVVNMSKYI